MANKKTQREFFAEIAEVLKSVGRDDLVEFVDGRVEALDKKSASRKPTKTQEANEVLKDTIANVLEGSEGMTVTEILATKQFADGTSNQKITALLTQMVKDGRVVKSTDKKKVTRFALAE